MTRFLCQGNRKAHGLLRKVLVLEPADASAHIGLGYARYNLEPHE